MIVAETVVEGRYSTTSGPAFSRLAGYIFGKNRGKQKIAMTAPVLQEKKGTAWSMMFVMPEGYTLETTPVPLDASVVVREVKGKKVAVIRYSGLHSESNLQSYAGKLTMWLEKKGYRILSPPRAASYDPPWSIPFFRRNEVHIDVE